MTDEKDVKKLLDKLDKVDYSTFKLPSLNIFIVLFGQLYTQ